MVIDLVGLVVWTMHCLTSRPGRNIPFNRTHGFANGPVKAVADARVEEPDGAAIAAQECRDGYRLLL